MRKIFGWISWTLMALVATLVVTGVAIALWLVRSVPDDRDDQSVAGLHGPVRIVRDSHGIPHILSRDRHDAFFALGRLHAQERLFQMELGRRLGRGELAAVMGATALPMDTYARTIGAARAAEADYATASPDLKAALAAYADGVNSWIAGRDRPLPPEFTLLILEPAPWTPVDSLLVGKMMALMLTGNWQLEALRARLAARLDGETLEFLTPPVGGGPAPDGAARLPDFAAAGMDEALHRTLAAAALSTGPIGPGASNAWAVAGDHTATGKPILANDPHLGLAAPGLWYLAHLSAPDMNVVGATLPGVPFPLLGHNDHVAWGLTTTGGDTADLFVETPDPQDAGRYLTPDGPQPFETRQEVIDVRFAAPVTITVRTTRHGPVISDMPAGDLPRPAGTALALAHTALIPGDHTPQALLGFIDARNADDFLAAAHNFMSPQQNLTYADDRGTIGMVSAGLVPIRRSGDGRLPADGASGAGDWVGFVPFEGLPQVRNPASGRVLNANNAVTGPDAPYFIGKDYDLPYRAGRLAELLAAVPAGYGLDDAARGQADTLSPFAVEFTDRLIALYGPATGRAATAIDLLKSWDRHMSAESPAPLILTAWARAVNRRLFESRLGLEFIGWAGPRPLQLRAVLGGESQWCDDPATPAVETCEAQIRGALDDALTELAALQGGDPADWRWDHAHAADMRHPLFRFVPGLDGATAITPPLPGGDDTLLRAAMRFGGPTPYAAVHGAGYRAIYDLADLDRSRFVISTGESGNPYSPHWDDLAPLWAEVRYVEIPTEPAAIEKTAASHQQFLPR
ncbi:penicillin acylase family protein [Zavarzinia sp.]|uniref:penicillin acylase family protein n=1 Tax=Zavarzinia sp. TaxID=2027920 RepID=UPI00356502F1